MNESYHGTGIVGNGERAAARPVSVSERIWQLRDRIIDARSDGYMDNAAGIRIINLLADAARAAEMGSENPLYILAICMRVLSSCYPELVNQVREIRVEIERNEK